MSKEAARGRIGQAILMALAEGMAVPEADCPVPPPQRDHPAGLGPLVDLLKVVLKLQCERHDVAQKLVASVAELEQIAADDGAKVPALRGWRREVFGEAALALKQGRMALGMAGKNLAMVPLLAPGADRPAKKVAKS
jgi:ribonuclease D